MINVCQYVKDSTKNPANPCLWPLVSDAAILDRFPLFKKFADLKNMICLSVARATLAPDFQFLKNLLTQYVLMCMSDLEPFTVKIIFLSFMTTKSPIESRSFA